MRARCPLRWQIPSPLYAKVTGVKGCVCSDEIRGVVSSWRHCEKLQRPLWCGAGALNISVRARELIWREASPLENQQSKCVLMVRLSLSVASLVTTPLTLKWKQLLCKQHVTLLACLLRSDYLLTEGVILSFFLFFLQEWHKRCFTHSASTHCLTVCVRLILRVCVCLPPSCLPASDSVPPSFSLLLLLLSLGLLTGKTPTHSLSLNPGNKRGSAAGAGLTSPGAHHLWSSSGCLSDRRVCWNIHVFFFFCPAGLLVSLKARARLC